MSALVVRVGANISDFQREMNEMINTTQRVGGNMVAVGQGLSKYVTAPLVGIATAATIVGTEFERKMSTVEATTSASAEEIAKLERVARELGSSTIFGARQVAGAMDEMGLAGWNAAQVYDALPGVLNLAASSGLDLSRSTSIVTSAINAFGLEASDAGRVVDVLATANKNSNISVAGLGEALKYVGSVAGAFGYTIEDVSLAIGLMANGGMAASQAGTSLRAAITELANPTAEAAAQMDKLGITMFDAEGEAKPLNSVLKDLRNGLDGMSTEQRNAALSTIFGTTALTGMSHIINASDDDFNNLINNLANADGNAQKFADTMQNNLHSDLAIMRAQLEEAGIVIFQILVPALRTGVGWISDMVDRFNELNPETQEAIIRIAGIAAAIGPALIIGGKFIMFLGSLKTALAVLKGGAALGGVKTALGTTGLVGSLGSAKAALGTFKLGLLAVKAAPFVAAGALIVGAIYGIYRATYQEAIPSIDDLADKIVGLEGYVGDASERISEETQEIVGSFARMHIEAMTEIRALGSTMNEVTEGQMYEMAYMITNMTNHTIAELERRRDEGLAIMREHYEEEGILTQEEIDARVLEAYEGWNRRITDQQERQAQMLSYLEKAFDEEGQVVEEHFNTLLGLMEEYRYDAMESLVTHLGEREFVMANWHNLEEAEQQQHFLRLLEMARENHGNQIEALEERTSRELALLANHHGAGLSMTQEHYSAILSEMGYRHQDELNAINQQHDNIEESLRAHHRSGLTMGYDHYNALVYLLKEHYNYIEGIENTSFNQAHQNLRDNFVTQGGMTEEQLEALLELNERYRDENLDAALENYEQEQEDLSDHFDGVNELTDEHLDLVRDSIMRGHEDQRAEYEQALDDQLEYYADTYSDISRNIDLETGRQLSFTQRWRRNMNEEQGFFAAGWNALNFNRHRLEVEYVEIGNNPFGSIGQNANGTFNWRGGLTWVGERGPEIVNLPRGAQVMPAPLSSLMQSNLDRSISQIGSGGNDVRANMSSNQFSNSINFSKMFDGAKIYIRDDHDIQKLSEGIAWHTQRTNMQMGGG